MMNHVAIIMDGNGRWAQGRLHPRVWGHVRGSRKVSEIVEEADNLGVKALTLYAFSSENWSRPKQEVKTLFRLLRKFLLIERERILRNKIRFNVIGIYHDLPDETKQLIEDLKEESKDFDGLKLTFAFGYGGRDEIIRAANRAFENKQGPITADDISNHLFSPDLGDVDLLIRTGGDQRISNFLLWQSAYAEFFFTPTYWPDFSRSEFRQILESVSKRERRFGALGPQKNFSDVKKLAMLNKESLGQELRN